MEKSKTRGHRPKKGSQHADVIDRLDFTGVGPSEFRAYRRAKGVLIVY